MENESIPTVCATRHTRWTSCLSPPNQPSHHHYFTSPHSLSLPPNLPTIPPRSQWPNPVHPPLTLRECLQSLPKRRLNRPNQPANKPPSLASFQKQRRLPRHRQVRNASSRVRVFLSLRFHPVRLEMTRVL